MGQFKQVDVFTSVKFQGNPVAVFFEADNLSTSDMQSIANWTNLSEATFVLKPTDPKADYKLRIFTPMTELPFAGHPTIGSCHALLEAGLVKPKNGKVIQQCRAGLVELTIKDDDITFKLPYYDHYAYSYENNEELLSVLGIKADQIERCILVDDGPKWLTLQLKSAKDVLAVNPDHGRMIELSKNGDSMGIGIFGIYEHETTPTYESRNFCPLDGVNEDPVCGSGAGAVGSVLAEFEQVVGKFNIKQGSRVGRDGKIKVEIRNPEGKFEIHVGGNAVTCINGTY